MIILIIIIIIFIIFYLFNKYLTYNNENFENQIFGSLPTFYNEKLSNMYLFICCDNYASIQIIGKYINKTFTQSGYNSIGSYFLENISLNDKIKIDISNNQGNGGVCISYIWNKQLYILDENGYDNNANKINYTTTGNNGWTNKIASSIENTLPWMKNWISMSSSMSLSFNIGNTKNSKPLSNDMILFLGIDDKGTVKLNGTQVYNKDQPWNEIINYTIPNVNNNDNLTIDCTNLGGPGGISLTYLWQGYVYAFPSSLEGFNSTINIINFTTTNITTFVYCQYITSIGYPKCESMSGSLIFNGPNWLRSCDGNCNFSFNTIIKNNSRNSWIYDKTINNWYITVQNNLVDKWSNLNINSNTYMTISFYINPGLTNSNVKSIFQLCNINQQCCVVGTRIPYLELYSGKLYLFFDTTKNSGEGINFSINSNQISYITLTFNYNTIKAYVNGKIVSNQLFSDPLEKAVNNASLYISNPWYPTGVNIKDFTIYNYVLSDNEIKYYYNDINDGLNYNKIDSEFINNTPENNILNSASVYLPLEKDFNNIGTGKAETNVNGPVTISTYNNKQCTLFNNSLSTYLSIPFSMKDYTNITFGYWLSPLDDNYYTPTSIGNTNWNQTEFFQTDVYGNTNICMFVNLPNQWTVSFRYGINYMNKWTFVTYSCTQAFPYFAQMYINGEFVGSQNGTGPSTTNSNIFIIGRSGDNARAYNGYIKHFFAFNSILSVSDIKDIYNSTK